MSVWLRRTGSAIALALTTLVFAAPASASGGVAVEGVDRARLLPPAGAVVQDYENAGYRLQRVGDEILVEVDNSSLESSSRFSPPTESGSDPISRLARSLTAGADTQYLAVSRILGWVARSISYRLDRGSSQDADRVLARREGYCTGIARLTVALLRSAGIPAREVAGYVTDAGDGVASGYHRWIEAYLPDRGWVFSDPSRSHHYVPATYLRFASETLDSADGLDGLLIARRDSSTSIDLYPYGAPGITARRNSSRRFAAALNVSWEAEGEGLAVLTGASQRRSRRLIEGQTAFLGLEPGHYTLRLEVPDGVLERAIEFPDRVRRSISVPAFEVPSRQRTRSTIVEGEVE